MKVSIELRKKAKTPKIGVLNLRVYDNGKRKYKSLGIELEFKFWDKAKQKVKSNYVEYKALNEFLNAELTNFEYNALNNTQITSITAIQYFKNKINEYKETTKANYNKTLKQFTNYLDTINQNDILLRDLTLNIGKGFKEYLINKGIQNNTIHTHLGIIKALINKAIDNNTVQYTIHPFQGVKVKKIPPQKTYLSEGDIRKLISTDFKPHLNKARDVFIFQLFSQGMRITDVLLLKYSNLSMVNNSIKLEYVQSKSKKRIVIQLNPMMQSILEKYIYSYNDTTIQELNKEIQELTKQLKKYEYINTIKGTTTTNKTPIKPPFKVDIDLNNVEVLNTINDKIQALKTSINNKQAEILKYKLSKMNSDNNIFFNDKIFKGFKSGNDLNKAQLKRINSIKGKLNYNYKTIAKQLNIQAFSTHTARHSYTMLALENNISIENISLSLGHSDLKTTYSYIHSLPINQLDNEMNILGSKFI